MKKKAIDQRNYHFGLLKYDTPNLGDDIQSLAALQYLPRVDHYILRDGIGKFTSPVRTKVILNGWFMHTKSTPEGSFLSRLFRKKFITKCFWPPHDSIYPLFISFHITKDKIPNSALINKQLFDYYKQYEPIGCRDYHTMRLFQNLGIEAYFSGCLTLTLKPLSTIPERNDILFVDPFGPLPGHRYPMPGSSDFRTDLWKNFPAEIRNHALFITHYTHEMSRTNRFVLAKNLLNKYARAKLVITSRIHCAFPCLAFGTPVIFITPKYASPERFDEKSLEFFRRYSLENIKTGNFDINWENPEPNFEHHLSYAEEMRKKCEYFVM